MERTAGRQRARLAAALLAGTWLGLLAAAASARADGGSVRAHAVSGGFAITLFSAPTPLRAGRADLSVLVQEARGDAPVLDAAVRLRLEPPSGSSSRPIEIEATASQATNKLLYAAPVDLPLPGEWRARVDVRRDGATGDLTAVLSVGGAAPPLGRLWPWLVAPPAAVALFALHQWLERRQRGAARGQGTVTSTALSALLPLDGSVAVIRAVPRPTPVTNP